MRFIGRTTTILAALALAVSGVACGDEDDSKGGAAGGSGGTGATGGNPGTGGTGGGTVEERVVIDANITADTTFTADKVWELDSQVFVKNGATLTIEAGTRIEGNYGTALVITRGSKIIADGRRDAPIVFTATDPDGDGLRPGDWGGLILLGRAPINTDGGENSIEGFPAGSTDDIAYGGDDPADDSGVLRFVRIEYAGWEFAPDEEINALTLGGVGNGTTLEYIQTHMGADDGIEFFGGTANAKYLVVTRTDDDAIDWDLGYQGKIQFAVIQMEDLVGNNGYEADNDGSDMNKTPRSKPTIYNVTMVGSGVGPGQAGKTQLGMTLREGTGGILRNHIVLDFPDFAIDVVDAATTALFDTGDLSIANSIVFGNNGGEDWNNPEVDDAADDDGFDEEAVIMAAANANRNVDPMLVAPHDLTAPNFLPQAGSPALEGGATPPDDGFFDSSATFIGAFGTENWMDGWTAFPAHPDDA